MEKLNQKKSFLLIHNLTKPRAIVSIETLKQKITTFLSTIINMSNINEFRVANGSVSKTATLANGDGFLVTWQSGPDIFAQVYNKNGSPSTSQFKINTNQINEGSSLSVTGLKNDGFVVTWTNGSGGGVYGQRYDSNGNPLGTQFQANTSTTSRLNDASVISLTDGGFLATWSYNDQGGFGSDQPIFGLYGQKYDVNGNPRGGEFRLNSSASGYRENASVVSLTNGGFVITWGNSYFDNAIRGQRFDANSNPVGSEFVVTSSAQINLGNGVAQIKPSTIAPLSNGGFIVLWHSSIDGVDIYGQKYASNGEAVGSAFRVNTTTTGWQYEPSATLLANGDTLITWQSTPSNSSYEDIYAQRLDSNGNLVGEEFLVNTNNTQDRQFLSATTALSDGGYVITWTDQATYGIYAQVFNNDLVLEGTPEDNDLIVTIGSFSINGQDGIDIVDYSNLSGAIALKAEGIVDKGALGTDTLQSIEIIIANSAFVNTIDASDSLTNAVDVNLAASFLILGDVTFDVYNFNNVEGSQLADQITGNEGINSLDGQGGDDLFFASLANDTIVGGEGIDTVDYSFVDSAITLQVQGIIFKANGETDTVQVEQIVANGSSSNLIDASSSSTTPINIDLSQNTLTVIGLPSGDVTFTVVNFANVTGSQTDDLIIGDEGNNSLDGQGGDDLFFASLANDTITGGVGVDTVDYSNLTTAITLKPAGIIDKGELGIDTVSAERIVGNSDYLNAIDSSTSTTSSLNVDLASNSLTVFNTPQGTLSFTVENFSNIIGSQLADSLKVDDANNNLNGSSGNDTLIGGLGADTLDGGAGIDTASYATATSSVTFNLTTNLGTGEALGDRLISIENLTGSTLNDNLTGNNGINILNGGAGNDNLSGSSGNDTLIGDAGNDVLTGGLGIDSLDGGLGADTASYSSATSAVTVNLTTNLGSLGEANGDILVAIENLIGSNYNDLLTGNSSNNTLTGNNGNDNLTGGAGLDTLLGGNGNDTLIGGVGNDVLTGGAGKDSFRFNSSTEGKDKITDFSVIDDTLLISGTGFGGLTAGTLPTTAFVTGSKATTADHRFIYNSSTGAVFFDKDGIGNSFTVVQFATLNSGLALTNADFQVV